MTVDIFKILPMILSLTNRIPLRGELIFPNKLLVNQFVIVNRTVVNQNNRKN